MGRQCQQYCIFCVHKQVLENICDYLLYRMPIYCSWKTLVTFLRSISRFASLQARIRRKKGENPRDNVENNANTEQNTECESKRMYTKGKRSVCWISQQRFCIRPDEAFDMACGIGQGCGIINYLLSRLRSFSAHWVTS